MRVVTFSQYGRSDVLKKGNGSITDLETGKVLVRMSAIAINRTKALFREGK